MPDLDVGMDYTNGAMLSNSQSLGSTVPGAHSSKAVLSALRALQEKIRRLESERGDLLDECVGLKSQLRQQQYKHEHESTKLRTDYENIERSSRSFYESTALEKNELTRLVVKHEEEKKAMEKEAQYIKENAQRGEEERREASTRVKVLEKRIAHLENDLRDSAERANTTTLVHHRGKHDAEQRVLELEQQAEEFNTKLVNERALRIDIELKKAKTEEFLRNILSINQGLVEKIGTAPKKKGTKKKKGKKAGPAAYSTQTGHRMKAGMGESFAHGKGRNIHERLEESYGKAIPWLSGPARNSFHVVSAAQQSLNESQYTAPPMNLSGDAMAAQSAAGLNGAPPLVASDFPHTLREQHHMLYDNHPPFPTDPAAVRSAVTIAGAEAVAQASGGVSWLGAGGVAGGAGNGAAAAAAGGGGGGRGGGGGEGGGGGGGGVGSPPRGGAVNRSTGGASSIASHILSQDGGAGALGQSGDGYIGYSSRCAHTFLFLHSEETSLAHAIP
jgi:hypothetical protein